MEWIDEKERKKGEKKECEKKEHDDNDVTPNKRVHLLHCLPAFVFCADKHQKH